MSVAAHPYAASVAFGRLGEVKLKLEPILAILAIAGLVAIPSVGTIGAISTLTAGMMMCGLRPSEMMKQGLRHWYVIALPIFCILSFTWSREPALSLRFGVQLLATAVVAIAICRHLSPRGFVLTLFACLFVSMLASLIFGGVRDTGAWTGIYGSKNAFAGIASTFSILALGVALTHRVRAAIRSLALAGFVIGVGCVFLAQSMSAILFLVPTSLVLIAAMEVWRLKGLPAWVTLAFVFLTTVLMALAVQANWQSISGFILDATGKDLTLTGRTELWGVALALISERPVLGVGYQAFWVQGHADAEMLWYMFGIDSRSGFNFHNMYLSNAVEVGILGTALQATLLCATLAGSATWAIRSGKAVPATLFALTFVVVMGSFIEVPLFFQFSLRTVIVFATLIYARQALRYHHADTERLAE